MKQLIIMSILLLSIGQSQADIDYNEGVSENIEYCEYLYWKGDTNTFIEQ